MTDIHARAVVTPALVYLRGLKGPEPQIWWRPVPDHDGHFRHRILAWHRLDGETAGIPMAVLTKRIFPPPAMPGE
jgi:hypothetical protein